ncbi:hypothetical protein Ddye_019695 [Dipteronia dyeriana]|uniref:INO80 complex subunit B-like conserved region domain-containing protein n=1 Tax=Dipteronia dyeriana TaxID=168575 RepID=A0AAD9TZE4_9ROSI|nr:hypothetical protein Ddye_019695 [Dipteronia dyeriana]
MECFSGSGFSVGGHTVKKKRSSTSRRPRPDSQTLLNTSNFLPQRTQSIGGNNDGNQNFRDTVVGLDGLGSENKLKLKLKFGGVTHTIQTNSTVEHTLGGATSVTKSSCSFDSPQPRHNQDKGSYYSHSLDKGKGNGVRRKDLSRIGSSFGKGNSSSGKTSGDSISMNEAYEQVRKSKRVPKRRALDDGFDGEDDNEDDELRYLGKLGASKVAARYEDREVVGIGGEHGIYMDKGYMDEEEGFTSEDEPGSSKRKQLEKGPRSFMEGNESIPTTRNRALQSGKDFFSRSGASFIEFPNGLPPAPSKRQKEKLSEVEQQLKKAEAAQRRRMQSEKAAREAEVCNPIMSCFVFIVASQSANCWKTMLCFIFQAEAIRKILGDSGRKKKEEKLKKQRDKMAQGKSDTLASNTVRWVFGPGGTVVIFSEDIGLPNIFNPAPCGYPPPREKCAGPNCTNAYKYRDSKSKLPLCSLQCYRAIHPVIAC